MEGEHQRSGAARARSQHDAVGGNRLLTQLPAADRQRLLDRADLVVLEQGEIIQEPDAALTHVHFPLVAVVSLVVRTEDGAAAEVGLIGREGMLGLPLLYGIDVNPYESVVQQAGDALRVPAAFVRQELRRAGALQAIIGRYAHAFMRLIAQSAACNALHPVEQRLSRWILMQHDRASADTLPLTQDVLAVMLGVQRTSVNRAARVLKDQGAIRYSRGRLDVVDRARLERSACECYRRIGAHFEATLDPAGPASR